MPSHYSFLVLAARSSVALFEEPSAGNLHARICEGRGHWLLWIVLFGHEAGNGRYRQGLSYAQSAASPTRLGFR
jgi:hypothetical protein